MPDTGKGAALLETARTLRPRILEQRDLIEASRLDRLMPARSSRKFNLEHPSPRVESRTVRTHLTERGGTECSAVTRPAKSPISNRSSGRASRATLSSTFGVGRRFSCTMRIDCGQLDPAAVIRPVPGEWRPRMPERLDEEELAHWRAGRNAIYLLAALTIGARLVVADA
jgi:hypothetical protein